MNNLAELYHRSALKYGSRKAFFYTDQRKKYVSMSYAELLEKGLCLSEALIDLGVKEKENVAIFSDNRIEWIISDCALALSSAVSVPRGSDITNTEIEYIINHTKCRFVFVENKVLMDRILSLASIIDHEFVLILMQSSDQLIPNAIDIQTLLQRGKKLREKGLKNSETRSDSIDPNDLCTIIYTSGTTGQPKGVQLTHSNLVFQIKTVTPLLKITENDRAISILPIWHIFERCMEYCFIFAGASTYYSNILNLKRNFIDFKPTFFGSAPRVWETLKNGILEKIADPRHTSFFKRLLFKISYFYSERKNKSTSFLKGNEICFSKKSVSESILKTVQNIFEYLVFGPFTLSGILMMAVLAMDLMGEFTNLKIILCSISFLGLFFNVWTLDRIVLKKIRDSIFGGHLNTCISGGGALPNQVDRTLTYIGIQILEGYGMTETSPVISIRTSNRNVLGSVGRILSGTQLQIRSEQNEILTEINEDGNISYGKPGYKGIIFAKGPHIMKGYYLNPEITSQVLTNGWMNTGDIGIISFNKTISIVGRAKETIVLRGGENVEPVPIEIKLQISKYINQCMVIGQDKKNLGVIIVPNFDLLADWAKEKNIQFSSKEELLMESPIQSLYKSEIKSLNNSKNGFKSFEQVSPFLLVSKPFEVGDELTNLLKLKRAFITEKYKDSIEEIYNEKV